MRGELIDTITKAFPDVSHSVATGFDVLTVSKGDYLRLAEFLKSEPDLDFNHCSDLSGVDYLDYIEIVCHLYSYKHGHGVRLKARVTRSEPEIDSLTSLWATCGFHEREAWDLYGIVFKGHPDLRRILSDDDQPGHPYRKDVPLENDEEWLLRDEKLPADYGLPEEWGSA